MEEVNPPPNPAEEELVDPAAVPIYDAGIQEPVEFDNPADIVSREFFILYHRERAHQMMRDEAAEDALWDVWDVYDTEEASHEARQEAFEAEHAYYGREGENDDS